MKENDNTFRIHLRLNRVEYADLIADIESHEGYETARIRMLLRRGFLAENGTTPTSAPRPVSSRTQLASGQAPTATNEVVGNELDKFNLNPLEFSIGADK